MDTDNDPDRYKAWYGEKLWTLLPALYRAEDSARFDEKGPLQEIVERVGSQAAIVRRSIDRLWEDQSIESCDDWVIDYLGDLVATNLVANLDARSRRIDVAKTIYYRRRKGTVGLLEELATDITGWSARVVEMFQRMGRTRHGLDPAIGVPALPTTRRGRLQRAQRLVGVQTRTGVGGFADLRNVHGAALANYSAFDEFFHSADLRRGRGKTGWHNIPHLGVFVWRLKSFSVEKVTPVQVTACPDQYTFDPTGRDLPLFASGDHPFGDKWVSPRDHQVRGPITAHLLAKAFADLYPDRAPRSLGVFRYAGGTGPTSYVFVPKDEIKQDPRQTTGRFWIDPERGRIIASPTAGAPFRVDYHYGFSTEIGAGPYERRLPGVKVEPSPLPIISATGGGGGFVTALNQLPANGTGTVRIDDSLTYGDPLDLTGITNVEVRAQNLIRPLIRPATESDWELTGNPGAKLRLDGLFISGANIVLKGTFDEVTLVCCTLDPGRWNKTGADWAKAADRQPLVASNLRIEGTVRRLVIERCITGPIEEVGTGTVELLEVRDSIVQATRPATEALWIASGEVTLVRTTVLGSATLHRLDASESILHGDVTVEDIQHGCVRFSAWREGSALPRKYESQVVATGVVLIASDDFGQPSYGQLLATAGRAILEGAEDGSEMGAFAREKNSIKERSLLIKYQEYLPLGLEPVVVNVT